MTKRNILLASTAFACIVGIFAIARDRSNAVVARAELLVVRKTPVAVPANGPCEDGYSTHICIIRSLAIAERATKMPGLTSIQKFANSDGASRIKSILSAEQENPEANPTVIKLAVRGVTPAEGVAVLEAVIKAYQDYIYDTYDAPKERLVKDMDAARNAFQKKINAVKDSLEKSQNSSRLNPMPNTWLLPIVTPHVATTPKELLAEFAVQKKLFDSEVARIDQLNRTRGEGYKVEVLSRPTAVK